MINNVRYFGDVIYIANAGLQDIAQGQDLVTRLRDGSASFRTFVQTLADAGMGTPVAHTAATDVSDATWQFTAVLTSGEAIFVAGSTQDVAPTVVSNDFAGAIALLMADVDFVNLLSGAVI